MSDNKYIIDKDSLTGIADAVRNKLGNGSSIDDPGKGYYPASHIASSFSVNSVGYSVSPSSSETYYWCLIDNYSLYFDKSFTAVEISWTSNSFAYLTVNNQLVGNKQSPCTVTFSNSQNGLIITTTNGNAGYSYDNYSYESIVIKLKDENGNYLIPKQNQLSYKAGSPGGLTTYTTNFQSELVFTPIPMSLTDINNNISTYLTSNTGGGDAPKIALLPNFYVGGMRNSTFTNLKDYGGFSNIYLIVGIYNNQYLGYLDMVNHPDKVGTYNGYDTYRFYKHYSGAESTLMDVQHDTSNGGDRLNQMDGYYGLTLSPCFIIYKEA